MDSDILPKIGLNEAQTKTYLHLIKSGRATPTEIANAIDESRTNTYNLLDQLEKLGLTEKITDGKMFYQAKNPSALKQLLIKRTQELNKTNAELAALLPSLQSTYHLTHHRPGVVNAEGAEALQIIYDDIVKNRTEPLIFPSSFDRDDPAISDLIDTQIARQQAASIGSKVLLPKSSPLSEQKEELAKQHVSIAPVLKNRLPAQIMIYGDNVAFTTFQDGISSTVITNPDIAETMRFIFKELWPAEEETV